MTPTIIQHQESSILNSNQRLKLAIDMLLDYWLQSPQGNPNNEQKEDNSQKTSLNRDDSEI